MARPIDFSALEVLRDQVRELEAERDTLRRERDEARRMLEGRRNITRDFEKQIGSWRPVVDAACAWNDGGPETIDERESNLRDAVDALRAAPGTISKTETVEGKPADPSPATPEKRACQTCAFGPDRYQYTGECEDCCKRSTINDPLINWQPKATPEPAGNELREAATALLALYDAKPAPEFILDKIEHAIERLRTALAAGKGDE